MSRLKKAFALTLLTALPMTGYSVCTDTWSGSTSGTWNLSANWGGGCVPGGTVSDTAIFGTNANPTVSISSAPTISPTLNTLDFTNGAATFTITGASPQFLEFTGAASTLNNAAGNNFLSVPIEFGSTTLTITVAGSNILTSTGVGTEAVGSTGSSIVTEGTGSFINHGQITILDNISVLNGGTFNYNLNTLSTLGQVGAVLHSDTMAVSSNLENANFGNVGLGLVGSLLRHDGLLSINGGAVTNINQDVAITGGAMGVLLGFPGAPITLNGGSLLNQNNGSINLSTGAWVNIGSGTLTSNGGILTNDNTNSATATSTGARIVAGPFVMNGGTFTQSNSGAITTTSTGASFTSGSFVMTGGTFANSNSGTVDATSFGSVFNCTTFVMNDAGTVSNSGTPGTVALGGIGSLINATTSITLNSGLFTNDDTVRTPIFDVNLGSTLAGIGTFESTGGAETTAVTNAGIVVPGDPGPGGAPGIMTILGGYTQTSTGTLVINILNPTSASALIVEGTPGTATLAGTVEVAFSPGATVVPGDVFSIVQTSNGVIGRFSTLQNFNITNMIPFLRYFPTFVQLGFAPSATRYPNFFETLFASINHLNRRLDRQTSQLRERFQSRMQQTQATQTSSKQTSKGLKSSHTLAMATPSTSAIASAINYSSSKGEYLGFANYNQLQEKQEQLHQTLMKQNETPWNVYFGPTGDLGHVMTKKDSVGFNYWSAGALTGFDYAWSQVGAGFMLDYDHISGHAAHHWGRFMIDQLHGSLYTTYAPRSVPQIAVNAIIGGGYDWYQIRRNEGLVALPSSAKGTPRGAEFDALLGFEYALDQRQIHGMPCNFQIVPLVSVQYVHLFADKYRERNAATFDLKFASQTARSLRTTLGTRINYSWEWTNVVFTPEFNLGWQREFQDKGRHVKFTPADVTFTSTDLTMGRSGRNVALAGVDLLLTLFNRYGIEASYDFEWNRLYRDHSFYLGANFKF